MNSVSTLWLGLRDLLDSHAPFDESETRSLMECRQAFEAGEAMVDRSHPGAHFTASCFCVDHSGTKALLLHHKKLGKLLQPGGHIEPTDASVASAAMRELSEEALPPGSAPATLLNNGRLFDVDAHFIPASAKGPAHRHMDLRFIARLPEGYEPWCDPSESTEVMLVELSWIEDHSTDPGLLRMARKASHVASALAQSPASHPKL